MLDHTKLLNIEYTDRRSVDLLWFATVSNINVFNIYINLSQSLSYIAQPASKRSKIAVHCPETSFCIYFYFLDKATTHISSQKYTTRRITTE